MNGGRAARGAVGVALPALLLVAARRWLRVVIVDGSSMRPAFDDGDRLLALYAGSRTPVDRGAVVVVRAPEPGWTAAQDFDAAHTAVVKRVTALGGDARPDGGGRVPSGAVYVESDGQGYDSRVFGPLPRSAVVGRVLVRLGGQSPGHGGAG